MTNFSSHPRPLDRLFAHIGWNDFVRNHSKFPLKGFEIALTYSPAEDNEQINVRCMDIRTGELVTLTDKRDEFPSGTLVASLRLLCGPISEVMSDYNRSLNRRLDRNRRS